jgi:hypothetical protein
MRQIPDDDLILPGIVVYTEIAHREGQGPFRRTDLEDIDVTGVVWWNPIYEGIDRVAVDPQREPEFGVVGLHRVALSIGEDVERVGPFGAGCLTSPPVCTPAAPRRNGTVSVSLVTPPFVVPAIGFCAELAAHTLPVRSKTSNAALHRAQNGTRFCR